MTANPWHRLPRMEEKFGVDEALQAAECLLHVA